MQCKMQNAKAKETQEEAIERKKLNAEQKKRSILNESITETRNRNKKSAEQMKKGKLMKPRKKM